MRVVFPLIAQRHQTLHALPIALEMAIRHADVEVHVACLTQSHMQLAKSLASLYPDSPVIFDLMHLPDRLRARIERHGLRVVDRLVGLFLSRHYFKKFTSIVVPESTSLYLRKMGVKKPLMVWTGHGAGDRAIGFANHLRRFDFLTIPGRKVEKRMLQKGLIRPGAYHRGTYAKFDVVQRLATRGQQLFDNDRPTVLYNPHFVKRLSSWTCMGQDVLDYFAQQDRYNLIFAPHFRLFDNDRTSGETLKQRYGHHRHMLLDPGSQQSIDMTYTMAADLYLGDVSSQVAEFMIRPRPCLFLNAHQAEWRGNPNYQFWTLGPIIETTENLGASVEEAFRSHPRFLERQRQYVLETFENTGDKPTAPAAADAIIDFLRRTA
ncbi:sensor domain-containing protein [Gluconobacter wancherniae]|uniref:sensor domain-containing protein n=1 Tax=Gluconobacter wancherniae TaxID=1307955 RepID=UPI001B8C52CF|nr:sensor domain-containing protein [Gluconobacter wancherniae]MBS1093683.1 sensor domain-containing protein [Gluconobacter wancherniae]